MSLKSLLTLLLLALTCSVGKQARESDFNPDGLPSGDVWSCQICKMTMFAFQKTLNLQATQNVIEDYVMQNMCNRLAKNSTICTGIMRRIGKVMIDAVTQSILHPDYFCEELAPTCQESQWEMVLPKGYVDRILSEKPSTLKKNDYLNRLYQDISGKTGRPTVRAVHFSDAHVDNDYNIGADTQCNTYLCCRAENGFPTEPERQAKAWGSLKCDIPKKTFMSFVEFVVADIKPEFVIWTGDNSPHYVWADTEEQVIASTVGLTQIIKETFGKHGISVVPIQGNHDTWPINYQDFTYPGTNNAINSISEAWKDWLTPETLQTFKQYGYYSQTLTLKETKLQNTKVLAINTMACNNGNWAILKNRNDPGDQLAWLENELGNLERHEGQAIVIAHIPPFLDECVQSWQIRFRALMDRYQNVVRAGFYGHTHKEEVQITQAIYTDQNIGHSFYSGSLTTYQDRNPSFSVIEFDAEFMIPVGYKTYFLDIEKTNQQNSAKWELLHDIKQEYNLKDLSPDSIKQGLADQILANETVALQYIWNRNKKTPVREPVEGCDSQCRLDFYCYMTTSDYFHRQACRGMQNYDFIHEPMQAVINYMTITWIKQVAMYD